MSRASGTLQTTYNASRSPSVDCQSQYNCFDTLNLAYYPPSLMPGYQGHVPTTQYQYGETFGNVTAKYFQDYRSETLSSSQSAYARGGYFPTPYTNQPELVMNDHRRSRDQYLHTPKYSLGNTDVDRTDEIRKFHQLSQQHRDTYTDRSGTLHPVEHFTLPVSNETMYETNLPYSSMLLRHTSSINIPVQNNFPPVKRIPKQSEFQLFPSVNSNANSNPVDEQPQLLQPTTMVNHIC